MGPNASKSTSGAASSPTSSQQELRVLLLGLQSSGKTSLVRRMLDGKHPASDTVLPTMSFESEVVTFGTPRTVIKDVSGKEQMRKMWKKYLTSLSFNTNEPSSAASAGPDVLMFLVDGSDEYRFEEAASEFFALVEADCGGSSGNSASGGGGLLASASASLASLAGSSSSSGANTNNGAMKQRSVLVAISKCDRLSEEERTTVYQKISRAFDIASLARRYQHCGLLEVSSASGAGLDDLARFFQEVYSNKK